MRAAWRSLPASAAVRQGTRRKFQGCAETPDSENPVFGGYEVGIGFSGTCNQ
jgi:hypothetical protein